MFPRPSMTSALVSFWTQGQRADRAAYVTAALLMASGLVHLAILVISGASWDGPVSLRKPATFGLSFGLTLMTVTWVASFVPLSTLARSVLLRIFTAACVFETALISLQAWRGVPSHFNVETPFDAMVARLLAAGGFVLVVVIVGLTLAAFRVNRSVPISLRVAIRIGFVALLGAVAAGGFMIARGMMLVAAGDPQAAYAAAGALKPTHAVTMHAILVLPALGWLLSFADWTERRRLGVVLLAGAGYVMVAGVVAVGNIVGLELRQAPAAAVGLFATGAMSLLVAGLLAISAVIGGPQERRPIRAQPPS
jgi:hypothetical protein